jgi:hypothetical protein
MGGAAGMMRGLNIPGTLCCLRERSFLLRSVLRVSLSAFCCVSLRCHVLYLAIECPVAAVSSSGS